MERENEHEKYKKMVIAYDVYLRDWKYDGLRE